jgi:hypothetical protein
MAFPESSRGITPKTGIEPMTHDPGIPVIDRDGNRLFVIELTNRPGLFVRMDREDWLSWCAEGRPQALYAVSGMGRYRWTVGYKTPGKGRKGYMNAAHAIMKPPPGYVAGRRSADPLDLRRVNLRVLRRKGRDAGSASL